MYKTIRGIRGQELVYDLPFSPENVRSLLDKLDQLSKTPVEFIFKDEEIEYRIYGKIPNTKRNILYQQKIIMMKTKILLFNRLK
ncbi:MAG: hypothetical protein ACXW07_06430 [Nitrososphaeraceae archaeon]